MAGKRRAELCTNCGAKMKRISAKVANKFTGIGNGCTRCNHLQWDGRATTFSQAFNSKRGE